MLILRNIPFGRSVPNNFSTKNEIFPSKNEIFRMGKKIINNFFNIEIFYLEGQS
jgi:hypothetical protein